MKHNPKTVFIKAKDGYVELTYFNLQFEAISCIKRELTAARRLSSYLQARYPQVQSCRDLTREVIEEYLIYLNTEVTETKHFHSELNRLRSVLDSIGKICDYPNLTGLFLNCCLGEVGRTKYEADGYPSDARHTDFGYPHAGAGLPV